MKSSQGWLVAGIALCLICAFQNCSENLPQQKAETTSSSTGPGMAPASTPTPQPSPAPAVSFTLNSVTAGPTVILPGSSVSLSTKVTSNQNVSNGTLRLSVFNSAQAMIWSQNFPGQNFTAGTLKDLVQTFVSTEDLPAGIYSVLAELSSADNSKKYFTYPNAVNFEIKPPIRVSVGNTMPYTDSLGRVWSADTGITGTSVPTTEVLNSVQGTNDPLLYSSFRWGQDLNTGAATAFTFTANVPSNGKYKVTLKWVEHYVFGPNLRLFSVLINGVTVLQDLDIFALAGGAFIAYDRTFMVTASQATPQVRVTFQPGAVENPKINAIEILGAY